jgi:murein DD-endopeptidase MepM/ murein hydrolase activator NlpD
VSFKLPTLSAADLLSQPTPLPGGMPSLTTDPPDYGGIESLLAPPPSFAAPPPKKSLRPPPPLKATAPSAVPLVPTSTPEPVKVPKGEINTSTWTGHGTHVTDGLDLNQGRKTAVDIMARAGTAVAAPANGVVLRLGSAQGGESMYFKDDHGYVWWLGHIDGRYSLPAGTRVRAGQTLSRISSHHAAPHLHLDRTLAPSNQFG